MSENVSPRASRYSARAGPATVPVLSRASVRQSREGPLLIESADCTIFVPRGWRVEPDGFHNLIASKDGVTS